MHSQSLALENTWYFQIDLHPCKRKFLKNLQRLILKINLSENAYESSKRFSLSSSGRPVRSVGVSVGKMSIPNVFDQRGTQTSVNVAVLDREVKP